MGKDWERVGLPGPELREGDGLANMDGRVRWGGLVTGREMKHYWMSGLSVNVHDITGCFVAGVLCSGMC